MRGAAVIWHDEELAWIYARHTWPRAELHRAFVNFWRRHDVTEQHIKSLCQRRGWKTGRTGCFTKGQTAHNKGQKMPFNANSAATQFKQGSRSGRARELYKPIGTERSSKDGYLERKVHDGMPLQSRWRAVHLIRWEAINGPVPDGHCLKCLDGDRTNTAPANWELLPRAMLPRLNGRRWSRNYDSAPAQLQPLIMATAKLEHAAREARKNRK